MKYFDLIVGARPNFIKIAPLIHSIKKFNHKKKIIQVRLIHTGQHYNKSMSDSFFRDLKIPKPKINFNCKSGTHANQTAKIMVSYEKILIQNKCDLCIVVGDVNSTMACAIAAKKLNIKVAHIEAGLRSGDITMPEEINRIITDSISDYCFTTSLSASKNLINEGKNKNQIFFVGNLMIDSLYLYKKSFLKKELLNHLNIDRKGYLVTTLHRVENTKNEKKIKYLLDLISNSSQEFKIVFPVHPRIRKFKSKYQSHYKNILFIEPQSYSNFIYLMKNSIGIITDSGGITEESSILNIPCITMRKSTERPETIDRGTNILVGDNRGKIIHNIKKLISGKWKKSKKINKWDGKTSDRIVKKLMKLGSIQND